MKRLPVWLVLFPVLVALGLVGSKLFGTASPAGIGYAVFIDYGLVAATLLLAGLVVFYWLRPVSGEVEAETRFRIYFERAMVGMAVVGIDRRWQVVNPALCEILGYPAEALQTKTWSELTHPDDLATSGALFDAVLSGESNGYELQKRYIRADGKSIDAFIAVQAVRRADASVDYFLIIIEDITARLAAEKALRASEERLRHLGDNLPDSYLYQCAKQANGEVRFLYVSSGVRLIHGCEPEDLINDPGMLAQYADPAQLPDLRAAEQESVRTLSDFSMELRVRRPNGAWGWLLVRSRPRRLASGEIIWDGVASDITARREAAVMLDLQARRAAVLLELPRCSNKLGEREFMQYALQQIEEITGSRIAFMHFVNDDGEGIELVAWSAATLEKYCTATFDKHYPLLQAGLWADAIRQKMPVVINDYAAAPGKHGLPPGHSSLTRLVSLPVVENGRVRMVSGVGNKNEPYTETDVESIQLISNETWRIVEQLRAERALKIATQVVNASHVVCLRRRASAGWPLVFVSDNVALWGYGVDSLVTGEALFRDMVHPDDLAHVTAEISRYTEDGASVFDLEYRLLTAAGSVIWVADRTNVLRDAAGEVEFYDSVLSDITSHKRQEKELADNLAAQRVLNKRLEEAHNQLLQSEKMASIGQLAAGIAHELNNPIGFVHSNLGTLECYLRDVMAIIDAYDKATLELGEAFPAQADISRLKEMCDFAYIRDDTVQLMAESKEGLARVRKIVQDLKNFSHVSEQEWQWADLHQGLDSTLNIVWNELKYKCKVVKEYGEIPHVHCLISQLNQVFMNLLVNAGHAIEKEGTITLRTAMHGSSEVCIEVSDTGKGIAPEHLSRIFEPFFTTKPVGKGTGLGLSLSYGIIDRHQGRIEVDSTLGVGTTFRVILPIAPETGESAGNNTETPP